MPLIALPLIPPALAALGEAALWVGGAILLGAGAYEGGKAISNAMSEAENEAAAKEEEGATTDVCTTCPPPKDPCSGLRKQLAAHEKKLSDYKANPAAHDNLGFLGQGRDKLIIAKRIASLQHQISNFREQLKACEERNG